MRDGNIAEFLKRLERWALAIKNNQFVGQDVATVYTTSTASSSDFTLAAGSNTTRYVIFVPDRQESPSGAIRFQVGSGSIGNSAPYGDFSLAGQDLSFAEPPATSNRIVIFMNFYNNIATTLYFKAYANATDTGNLYVRSSYSAGQAL